MSRQKECIFESAFTAFNIEQDGERIKKVFGRYRHNSTIYAFSLTSQCSGKYLFRGSVRALGGSGTVLKRKAKPTSKQEATGPLIGGPPTKEERVSTVIYCNSSDRAAIEGCVKRGVLRLYANNAILIDSSLSKSVRPDSITPAVAAKCKALKYAEIVHKDASSETHHKVARKLLRCCAKLPNRPMMSIKKTALMKILFQNKIGEDTIRELHSFWQFCIDYRICLGKNPVSTPPKKRRTVASHSIAATRCDLLTLVQQDVLYADCRKKGDGPNQGIALMLGSGLIPKRIVELKWRDFTFYEEEDFVVVQVIAARLTGATHNYSRPLFPQAAVIIRKRYNELLKKYDKTRLDQMPVVSLKTNPESPMKASALIQYATKTLQTVLQVSYKDLQALRKDDPDIAAASKVFANTYKTNLLEYCNLKEDSGTYNFLMANAFGSDTSNDSYIAYTSPEGIRRLYSILQCLKEDKKLSQVLPKKLEDGSIAMTFTPKQARCYLTLTSEIVIDPGEEIMIECPHGVIGSAEVHALTGRRRIRNQEEQIAMRLP